VENQNDSAGDPTADRRFRGNARQVLSLSEEKGLEITARRLWTEWTSGPIDYNYAQGILEQYGPDDDQGRLAPEAGHCQRGVKVAQVCRCRPKKGLTSMRT